MIKRIFSHVKLAIGVMRTVLIKKMLFSRVILIRNSPLGPSGRHAVSPVDMVLESEQKNASQTVIMSMTTNYACLLYTSDAADE